MLFTGVSLFISGITLFIYIPSKKILGSLLVLFSILLVATLYYGIFVETTNITVVEESIDLADYTGEEFKIILVSDLHVGRFNNSKRLRNAVKKILSIDDARYVFILGDLVNSSDDNFDDLDALKSITTEKWVYSIYGNHDYEKPPGFDSLEKGLNPVEGLPEKLSDLGVAVLDNSAIWTNDPQEPIVFGGIRDIWADDYSFSFTEYVSPEDTFILLCHNPDCIIRATEELDDPSKIDLVLSGHTHGGEVQLPLIGPMAPLPIDLPRSYDRGLHAYEDIPILITSGIGSIGSRIRLFNTPEIVVLTIK